MGVGKGSVAREIIKISDYVSIDTDDLIESMENRTIKRYLKKRVKRILEHLKKKLRCGFKQVLQTPLYPQEAVFIDRRILKR